MSFAGSLAWAASPSTAFTYQGRLFDGGNPANGSYDLQFSLYDDASAGNQLGSVVATNGLTVVNGVFTLGLDFGAVFDGTGRWLEVAERTNDASAFVTLVPRQFLAVAPYAIYAASAGTAGLATNVPAGAINSTALAPGAVTTSAIASGQVVRSLNGLRDDLVLAPGENITLTPSGSTVTIAAAAWGLAGNAGTTPGVDFLGTTDNQPLELRVGGVRALRLEPPQGPFGIPNVIGGSVDQNSIAPGLYGGSFIGGGSHNTIQADGDYSVIGGGGGNTIQTFYSLIGGGSDNTIQTNSYYSFLGGGINNTVLTNAYWSFLGGGVQNTIQDNANGSFLGGGLLNMNRGAFSVVVGGSGNTASGLGSIVGGGGTNMAGGVMATVGGGAGNVAAGSYAAVGGGQNNNANGGWATVAGGNGNTGGDSYATVGGGQNNNAGGELATVGGGEGNTASGQWATVGGGENNRADGDQTTVGGGQANEASGVYATVGGGESSSALGDFSAVGGGYDNGARGMYATVGGGVFNQAAGDGAFVGGGGYDGNNVLGNAAAGVGSVIAGGTQNLASGSRTAIGGGHDNQATNGYATVPGGAWNIAGGQGSFAAGRAARALHDGAFVWNDFSGDNNLASLAPNTVSMCAAGGYRLFSDPALSVGVSLAPGSGSWTSMSDRNAKEHLDPVNGSEILAKVTALPLSTWNYKSQGPAIRHLGPMAQDFRTAFGLGETDTGITDIDAQGVALAAIQGLSQQLAETRAQNAELKARIEKLERLLSTGK